MNVLSSVDLAQEMRAKGFCFLASYQPNRETAEIAKELGVIEMVAGIREVQELTPRILEASPPNIYSGNFGTDEFPFHTDLAHWFTPPHYLLLRCIRGTPDVQTRLIDSKNVIQQLGQNVLRRALVQPRRPLKGERILLRILDVVSEYDFRFRWDQIFIKPSTPSSTQTFEAVHRFLIESEADNFTLQNSGDTLIIDNWRMLHGRSSVPPNRAQRLIHRVYLSNLHE